MDVDFSSVADAVFEVKENVDNLLTWLADTFAVTFPIFLLVLIFTLSFRSWLAPWARHLLWTLVLVRLILPISVVSPFSAEILWRVIAISMSAIEKSPQHQLLTVDSTGSFGAIRAGTFHNESNAFPFSLTFKNLDPQLLLAMQSLLMAGAMIVAGATLFAFAQLSGWMRYGRKYSDPFCTQKIADAQRCLGINACLNVRTVHQLKSSATFDWFWPTILLPENFASMSQSEQTHLLWHEVARLRRGDSGASVLLAVVRLFHWWNPLFWWAGYSWALERELACDALMMKHLSVGDAEEYVHTLQNMQKSRPKQFRLAFEVPGFIFNLGTNSILRQRLRALSKANRFGFRWQYWFSWSVVSILAVVGLTDAAKMPREHSPIELPLGTIWRDSDITKATAEETETRTYHLVKCLDSLRPNCPDMSDEAIIGQVAQSINSLLKTLVSTETPLSGNTPLKLAGWNCHSVGQDLIVRATLTGHNQVERMLAEFEVHGFRQVSIELRTISTSLELTRLLKSAGGQVINSESPTRQEHFSPSHEPGGTVWTRTSRMNLVPMPVFARCLTGAEAFSVISEAQGDIRGCRPFDPNVTLFNGSAAIISNGTSRPFVTGLRSTASGFEPSVTAINEGVELHVFAFAESQKVCLRLLCRTSTIMDVRVRKLMCQSQELQIQVPVVREAMMESTAVLDSGDTLLLVPLMRDQNGQLTILLITPRIIESDP